MFGSGVGNRSSGRAGTSGVGVGTSSRPPRVAAAGTGYPRAMRTTVMASGLSAVKYLEQLGAKHRILSRGA